MKVMKFDQTEGTCNICINVDCHEEVHQYVCLVSVLTDNGEGVMEIEKRLTLATNKLANMKPLWIRLNTQIKLGTLRTCIFPIATYGCVT